jgi:hypothetical protein
MMPIFEITQGKPLSDFSKQNNRRLPSGTFQPQGEATRAEIASMLRRFLEVAIVDDVDE